MFEYWPIDNERKEVTNLIDVRSLGFPVPVVMNQQLETEGGILILKQHLCKFNTCVTKCQNKRQHDGSVGDLAAHQSDGLVCGIQISNPLKLAIAHQDHFAPAT